MVSILQALFILKKKEILTFVTTQIESENITLNEVIPTQEDNTT